GFRSDKRVAEEYPAFIAVLDETIAAVDTLIKEPEVAPSASTPANGAAAGQARKQLMAALKASEFIAQDKLDEWLDALGLPQDKRAAIIDAVDELDYEEAISELENS
ncbi:histidine kinase, partial [Alteromonadaceae bacterium A_SAG4]|nr:histidine kinase [Alteromonadaceae bacterium A_SAG4]